MIESNPLESSASKVSETEIKAAKEESIQNLAQYGATVKAEQTMSGREVAGTYRAVFSIEASTVTMRLVFGDYSGSDVVITNMTVLPEAEHGKGYGSQAVQNLIEWAAANGVRDIRATQVQAHNEAFWTKNGFSKAEDGSGTGDLVYNVQVSA